MQPLGSRNGHRLTGSVRTHTRRAVGRLLGAVSCAAVISALAPLWHVRCVRMDLVRTGSQCVHTTSRNASRPPTRAPLAKPHTALRPPRATAQSSRCERRCACGAADPCFPWPIYRQMPVQTCTNPSFSLRRPLRLPPRCAVGPLVERCRECNGAICLARSLLQDARAHAKPNPVS